MEFHILEFPKLPKELIKRADEIILVDKADNDIEKAISWAKGFNLPLKVCKMTPKRIYNLQSGAEVINKTKAIAFCAIGQPIQFFNFAKEFYELVDTVAFADHHKYDINDIKKLIKIAKDNNINTFITTQKDETKLIELTKAFNNYSFNVLELQNIISEIK